jgi:hypothetical protein
MAGKKRKTSMFPCSWIRFQQELQEISFFLPDDAYHLAGPDNVRASCFKGNRELEARLWFWSFWIIFALASVTLYKVFTQSLAVRISNIPQGTE